MKREHNVRLKNGETIFFATNMPEDEIKELPLFSNQYGLLQFFRKRGYWLKVHSIIKPELVTKKKKKG